MAADGDGTDSFGDAVSVDGDVIVVGSPLNSDVGAIYAFERRFGGENAWGQVAKIAASDAATADSLGRSVSLRGNMLVAGAPGSSATIPTNTGAAYVFARTRGGTNSWQQIAKLEPSDPSPGQDFGRAVTLVGDLAAVGAPGSNFIYVYQRDAGGEDAWGEIARIREPDPAAASNQFGLSIALDEGVLLASAEGPALTSVTGSAYLIPFVTEEWQRSGARTANNLAADDEFGSSVDLDGLTQIVGAPYRDLNGTNDVGAAYIFERGTSDQIRRLLSSAPREDAWFGFDVAVDGDIAVVGAPLTDLTGINEGLVYIFHRNEGGTNNWGQVAAVAPTNWFSFDNLGLSVDVSGDTVIAGRPGYAASRGLAEFFARDEGGSNNWGHVRSVDASDDDNGDDFGGSVAIDGDTAVVGAVGDSTNRGAAYILQKVARSTNDWRQVRKLTASDGVVGDAFGRSVAICGDTVLVAAYAAGKAYIFERNLGGTNTWGPAAVLAPTGAEAVVFGAVESVSLAGDIVVLGDPFADVYGTNSAGAAWVFERNAGGSNAWGQAAVLTMDSLGTLDKFGYAVAVDGQVVIAGAPKDDPGGISDAGRVHVFSGSLYGTPAISSLSRSGMVTSLTFPSQPAWQYDVEATVDLVNGPWLSLSGLLNLAGSIEGASTVLHTNSFLFSAYRIVREEP